MKAAAKEDDNLGSFYMGRMRPPPEPKRGLPKTWLAAGALFAFAAILWYAYPQGQEKYAGVDVPVITPDKDVYKFKPEDPGGMEVRHQDSTIFDPIDKKGETVEKLLPSPEEPLSKEEILTDKIEAPAPKLNLDLQMAEVGKGVEKAVPKPEAKKEIKPQPKPETRAEEKPPVAAAGFYIQLGSYQELSGAKTDWTKLQKKHPKFLKGLSMKTERVDLGKKGIWYRLYAGTLEEPQARDICAALKSANPGGCIVAKK